MIISVASGKGGTGKTTVSTNLALSLDRDLAFLDCDVEAPNAHLFLQAEMGQPRQVYTYIPAVDTSRCSGCGECARLCQFNALTVVADKVLLFPELCHGCKGCQEICPEQAISPAQRELGTIATTTVGTVSFGHGRLRVGEAMSPPLIHEVRSLSKGVGLTIIDAPPGTSCPAIAAMKSSDFVLLVTEPTPFGLHDLVLAHGAVKELDIPCGLVVNRSDLGDKNVHDYAEQEGVPILLEIPFDRKIAETYSHGRLLIEDQPLWKHTFQQLFSDIEALTRHQVSQ
jgi:MinD superfamily P-loop ATPase